MGAGKEDQDIGKKSKMNENDRTAMRAFLQRAEVRLSTMHRVAGIFLNGAGLLILLPIFTRNIFAPIFTSLINFSNLIVRMLMCLPLAISLAIPLYAIYLLFRELVQFYFTPTHPGFDDEKIFYPRFIISGIALPVDEVSDRKQEILEKQLTRKMIDFILPSKMEKKAYYDDINQNTKGEIIPFTRRVSSNPTNTETLLPEDLAKTIYAKSDKPKQLQDDIDLFHVMFGLAGVIDRELTEEVAKMEASLVRHQIYLRRLILRYIKAFLILIWTTLILGTVAACLENGYITTLSTSMKASPEEISAAIFYIGFILWAIFMPSIVKAPVNWIYDLTSEDRTSRATIQKDGQLVHFENLVIGLVIVSFFVTLFAAYLEFSNIWLIIIDIIFTILFAIAGFRDRLKSKQKHAV